MCNFARSYTSVNSLVRHSDIAECTTIQMSKIMRAQKNTENVENRG